MYQEKVRETSPWTRGLTTRRRRRNRGRQFEPMIGYKYPTIASGATPIGSAERAPDRKRAAIKDKGAMVKELMDVVRAARYFDNHESFDYIVDEIYSDYSHRELLVRS
jgi:hypothetical protein